MSDPDETAADTPTIADVDRLAAWLDALGLGVRGAARAPLHLRRQPERDLRAPPGRPALRHAHPPAERPGVRDDGIVREWRIIEALDGTDVPHTEAVAVCTDQSVLGPDLLPDGLRRRLVADVDPATVARAVRHRPAGAPRAGLPAGGGHRAAGQRRLAGQGPRATSAGPTASTSARSTAGPPSSSASRAASCRASTRRRPGCARTGPSTTSRGSCTATTSSPTSCSSTARRRAWPPSWTGRWARSATPSSTWVGSSSPGPTTPPATRTGRAATST